MIQIQRIPGTKLCELGGGSNPKIIPKCLGGKDIHVDARECVNANGQKCVDVIHNLSTFPWPLEDDEFDGVIAIFILEHVSYTKTASFLREVYRISKVGSKSVFAVPNTEKQVEWILNHQDGWDGKSYFISASEKLFGSQDDTDKAQEVHSGSYHCVYLNPQIATKLFSDAGFENILISPYGERQTDMVIQCSKPVSNNINAPVVQTPQEQLPDKQQVGEGISEVQATSPTANPQVPQSPPTPSYDGPNKPDLTTGQRAKLFDSKYFGQYPGSRMGFFWDDPKHMTTTLKVMERKPESVLELGCARGYILKRLEDSGIVNYVCGLDISKHAYLTRVSQSVKQVDLLSANSWWNCITDRPEKDLTLFDLCFSISFLEHVPEDLLPKVISEMGKTCKRGLHGVTFQGQEQHPDPTRCTLRTRDWWIARLPKNHEVVSVQELESGSLPDVYMNGDGRLKLNIGSAWTMFHDGWQNLDVIDAYGFASQYRYNFKQVDVKKGLPYSTGIVDRIFSSHMLEHLNYTEGLSFLKECRRVIRPDGGMRLLMPDAEYLMKMYAEGPEPIKYDERNEPYIWESGLERFDEVNDNCANASTAVGRLWALLHEGHNSFYDSETLCKALEASGWVCKKSELRKIAFPVIDSILKETIEMAYGFSLFVDAIPEVV